MRTVPMPENPKSMGELYLHMREQHRCYGFFDTLIEFGNYPDVRDLVECGVFQGGSTAALLTCDIDILLSCDVSFEPLDRDLFNSLNVDGPAWVTCQKSSLDMMPTPCDLLLLDTVHTYDHVIAELRHLGGSVRRFIIVHDTMYPPARKHPERLVGDAVKEWASENGWKLIRENTVGSGHMVIERC